MSGHCEDCGTRYSDGMCPNCHEEYFILYTQSDDIDEVSAEFAAKAEEQRQQVNELKAKQARPSKVIGRVG